MTLEQADHVVSWLRYKMWQLDWMVTYIHTGDDKPVHHVRMSIAPTTARRKRGNRERVEADMTRSVSGQLRRARDAIEQHGQGDGRQAALTELDNLAHRLPLMNQMATRNFEDVRDVLANGR